MHGSKELRSSGHYLSHDKLFGNKINSTLYPIQSTDLSNLKRDVLCHGIHRFFSADDITDDERMLFYRELGFDLFALFSPHLTEPAPTRVNAVGTFL